MKLCGLTLISALFIVASATYAEPPNNYEPWRMYSTYINGYTLGHNILDGVYGEGTLLYLCIEQSEHPTWESSGWDSETISRADKILFYGCINASEKKMSKEEFMKEMFIE